MNNKHNICIWGLLSIESFEFIHVSCVNNKLKGKSLFNLLHPDEISLAKRDLKRFVSTSKFGGSVTRCRMMDYVHYSLNWIIVDIIIYVATKDTLLIFLHQPDNLLSPVCNSNIECNIQNDLLTIKNFKEEQEKRLMLMSPSSSITINNKMIEYNQYLHILNTKLNSILLSLPTNNYYPNEFIQQNHSSCFHCIQYPIKLNECGEKIQTIVINYGQVTFILTYIEKLSYSNKQQQYISSPQRYHCQSCGTNSSPEWRRGPTGHKTLCNACGLRYSRSIARQINQQKKQVLFQSQNTPHNHYFI